MTLRVCVINGKGGCGKTTVSTHLAAAFASSGLETLLVDRDRHRGASRWHGLRPKTAARVRLTDWRKDFGTAPRGVQRVVIDCPASLGFARVREIVAEAEILVAPLLPSVFDQYGTEAFLDRIAGIKKIRKGRKSVLIVSNRFRERSLASRQLEEFLASIGREPFARIADSSAYPRLASQGLTAFDVDTKPMRDRQEDWMPLLEEIELAGRTAG